MVITDIKKELYRQKPTADMNNETSEGREYTCQIDVDGKTRVVYFDVPINECEFGEVVPAQLLIRWYSDIV